MSCAKDPRGGVIFQLLPVTKSSSCTDGTKDLAGGGNWKALLILPVLLRRLDVCRFLRGPFCFFVAAVPRSNIALAASC